MSLLFRFLMAYLIILRGVDGLGHLKETRVNLDALASDSCASLLCPNYSDLTRQYLKEGCVGSFLEFYGRSLSEKYQEFNFEATTSSESIGVPIKTALTLAISAGLLSLIGGMMLGYVARGKVLFF
mmetsp:Transcript_9444/g.13222  ORF Transcript_9444/g.13222 Transcript_9444/m.13222 type:complete len:126 (-) Transcript_9444:63-440(-)